VLAAVALGAAPALAVRPFLSVEAPRAPSLDVTAEVSGGWDSNVRLLSPTATDAGTPRADAFGAVAAGARTGSPLGGLFADADVQARRFLETDNGVLGSADARAGWRWHRRALWLTPAVDLSAFAWSAFPDDAHLSAAFVPELSLRSGRWRLTLEPAVLGRWFGSGADREWRLRASAGARLGRLDAGLSGLMLDVDAASAAESRRLLRADAWLSGTAGSVRAGARISGGRKALPDYPSDTGGEPAGRTDWIGTGSAFVRWEATRALAITASLEAAASDSDQDAGRFSRVATTLSAEWRWERLGAGPPDAPRRVVLRAAAPGAREVSVAGAFTDWAPRTMTARGDGAFVLEQTLPPGDYRCGLVVDGVWTVPDGLPASDDGFGGTDAVLTVPAP